METFGFDQQHKGLAATPDKPFFWRVADGLLYAEMPYTTAIRPPLLTDWESRRCEEFSSPRKRNEWLAGRALAKALVREQLRIPGIVEVREGLGGEPLVYRNGLPLTDVWLSIGYRGGRVAAVIGDRPVALAVRRVARDAGDLVDRFTSRSELRQLRRVFPDGQVASSVAWAVKEAALRATRRNDSATSLEDVRLAGDFSVTVDGFGLHAVALRVLEGAVVAVVARPLLHEEPATRIAIHGQPTVQTPAPVAHAVERSIARARRLADARARWGHRLRWQA